MNNYGRDAIWDLDTWAEIDAAVSDEMRRVSVTQRLFAVESTGTADGGPVAVPDGEVAAGDQALSVPENVVAPYAELSVPFWLTPAQAEAESALHQGRALARLAAKNLAMAVDHYVLSGTSNRTKLTALAPGTAGVIDRKGVWEKAANIGTISPSDPSSLFHAANGAISELLKAGWPEPYALVLSNELYTHAHSPIGETTDTPVKRLAGRVKHVVLSGALDDRQGVLVSLAGDPITIYVACDATATFTGVASGTDDRVQYRFRVFERLQYTITDPQSIATLSPRDASVWTTESESG